MPDFFSSPEQSCISQKNLETRLKNCGWNAADRVFIIVDIQLTGLYGGNGSFSDNDESLAEFMLGNMTRELAANTFTPLSAEYRR